MLGTGGAGGTGGAVICVKFRECLWVRNQVIMNSVNANAVYGLQKTFNAVLINITSVTEGNKRLSAQCSQLKTVNTNYRPREALCRLL